MAKKDKVSPEDGGSSAPASLPTPLPKGQAPDVVDTQLAGPVSPPDIAGPFINLFAHPQFTVRPKVPRMILYRGDTLDLARLSPSQFQRITTNADAANIVQRR